MADPAPLLPAYLILGTDRPKVRRAVDRLRRRVTDQAGNDLNVVVLDAEEVKVEALLEAAASPGLTFGTRLLLVLNGHKWNAKARQAIVAYLKDPMPETCVAVEAETIPASDALYKAVAKLGGVLQWNLPKKYEMAKWVREQAKARRLPMGAEVTRYFLDRCGNDPRRAELLDRELEKLAAYCGGHEPTAADVDAVCTPDDDAVIFDLMDAVGRRDRARSFELLEALYASGNPRNDAGGVFYSLKRHIEQLDAASQLPHADEATAAKQLKVHPFTARKLLEQRQRFDRRLLGRAYKALAEAEVGLRGRAPVTLESVGGVNDADRLVVELALARMLA
jgi:DNA polymerase-3 subunit delta